MGLSLFVRNFVFVVCSESPFFWGGVGKKRGQKEQTPKEPIDTSITAFPGGHTGSGFACDEFEDTMVRFLQHIQNGMTDA